jgi:hypothetical protein
MSRLLERGDNGQAGLGFVVETPSLKGEGDVAA